MTGFPQSSLPGGIGPLWPDLIRGPSAHGLVPWASTSSWALAISADTTWMPGTSPGKGCLGLHRGSHLSILHYRNCST